MGTEEHFRLAIGDYRLGFGVRGSTVTRGRAIINQESPITNQSTITNHESRML
jgi:hypothetical protein